MAEAVAFDALDWYEVRGRGKAASVAWGRTAGEARELTGQTVTIDGQPYTVQGVETHAVPDSFHAVAPRGVPSRRAHPDRERSREPPGCDGRCPQARHRRSGGAAVRAVRGPRSSTTPRYKPMGFTAQGGGQWVAEFRGEKFTMEKRRAEPGCPAGWYYFGPGHPDGVLAGSHPEDAAALAMACADQVPPR